MRDTKSLLPKFEYFKSPKSGKLRKVKNGYSWTVMLFGIIVLLFRREWKIAGIAVAIIIAFSGLMVMFHLDGGNALLLAGWIFYGFKANEQRKHDLLNAGYELVDMPEKTE
ncbi:DUF2628 domain-containing protein [Lactococcus allomyrinae]|uniref:DUF2628 domain-containing protein n=1 Tax=Lactococcus allomyrinae TaxID=2419773 RepID=A0A387BFN6_9LACT|nr:DUF2628 domain-containing protein [Lactococcus allomyrinae]AYF99786.1 DUF2628 domain-containing protein [Lactococcus allomyrinae]